MIVVGTFVYVWRVELFDVPEFDNPALDRVDKFVKSPVGKEKKAIEPQELEEIDGNESF